jgi:hypothetical protein
MNNPNERPEASPNCNLLLPPDQSIMVHLADGRVEYLLIKAPIALLDLLQEVADDKQKGGHLLPLRPPAIMPAHEQPDQDHLSHLQPMRQSILAHPPPTNPTWLPRPTRSANAACGPDRKWINWRD